MTTHHYRALLVSVGGTSEPIINAIKHNTPEIIIFFCSEQSKNDLPEILSKTEGCFKSYIPIITPNPDDLLLNVKQIRTELPQIMQKFNLRHDEILIDFTGGTKAMSFSLGVSTINDFKFYEYITGQRDKGGVGVVISGTEQISLQCNPWDLLGEPKAKEAYKSFNSFQFDSAINSINSVIHNVSEGQKKTYLFLKSLFEIYKSWDQFQHYDAFIKFDNLLYREGFKEIVGLLDGHTLYQNKNDIFRNFNQLACICRQRNSNKKLRDDKTSYQGEEECLKRLKNHDIELDPTLDYLSYDLFSNAMRRAKEGKYDDAVARLYRFCESFAQHKLLYKHNINSSDINIDIIPSQIRTQFQEALKPNESGKIQIGLAKNFQLLAELGDLDGQKIYACWDKFRFHLEQRNYSILAHGFNPISEDAYMAFEKAIGELFPVSYNKVYHFPSLQ